jgi:hypothetical protein
MGPTQPPIQWVTEVILPSVKQPVCEANHSLSSSVYVKNEHSYVCIPPDVFMAYSGQSYLNLPNKYVMKAV